MSTFKAIGVNRLDEPGPMVNVRVFDSLQKAQDFLQAFAGGIVLDSENTTVFQKGEK